MDRSSSTRYGEGLAWVLQLSDDAGLANMTKLVCGNVGNRSDFNLAGTRIK